MSQFNLYVNQLHLYVFFMCEVNSIKTKWVASGIMMDIFGILKVVRPVYVAVWII